MINMISMGMERRIMSMRYQMLVSYIGLRLLLMENFLIQS